MQSVAATGPDAADPGHVMAGQMLTVTYNVINAGHGETAPDQGMWTDYVYLSRRPCPERFRHLHDRTCTTPAAWRPARATEHADHQPPKNLTGPYYVFVVTDRLTATSPVIGVVFEAGQRDNNATATAAPILIDQPPPSDLVVTAITAPATAMSGDVAVLTWTVQNAGLNAASGSWRDTAYLSSDNVWDVNDTLIGYFNYTGTLQPGQSYTTPPLDLTLPVAVPGPYRIIVRTDIFDDIVETRRQTIRRRRRACCK